MPGSGNIVSAVATNIAANSVSANLVDGTGLETLEFPANVIIGATHSGAADGARITVILGGKTIVDDQFFSDANRFPLAPDDFTINAAGLAGENLQVRIREVGGVATTDYYVMIKAQPVAI